MLPTSDDRCDPALKACESAAKWSYHHLSWRTELTTNVCEALSTLPALRNCSINSHYCQLPLLQQKEKRRNSELKQLIHVVRRKTLLYTDILTMWQIFLFPKLINLQFQIIYDNKPEKRSYKSNIRDAVVEKRIYY